MASLCSFYNPSSKNHQNQIEWWKRAFDDGQTLDADELEKVQKELSDWREAFFVRRTEDVLELQLPKKTVAQMPVVPSEAELMGGERSYIATEKLLHKIFKKFVSVATFSICVC